MAIELACVCSQCSSKRNFGSLAAFLAIVSVAAVLFTGCEDINAMINNPPQQPAEPPAIGLELDDYVTAPEKDAAPITDAIDSSHYTGTVVWKTESGEAHTGNFAAGSIYKAELALSAKTGCSFIEVPANSFTYSGAAVTHDAGSEDNLTVTITFPKTAFVSGTKITQTNDIADYLLGEEGGETADDPVPISIEVELHHFRWIELLAALERAGKFVDLDLSGCSRATELISYNLGLNPSGVFDPTSEEGSYQRPDFTGEPKIVSLILPDAAEKIIESQTESRAAFKHFTALKSVTGAEVKVIGEYAFLNRATLTSVSFPKVTTLEKDAFTNCTALDSVDMPLLTTIGLRAFANCTGLASFSVTDYATSIDGRAFAGCLTLRFDITGSTVYSTHGDGKILIKDGTDLVLYPSATGTVTLDNSITGIIDGVFFGFTTLTGVTALNVTSIGNQTFMNCTALADVGVPAIAAIGSEAFRNCPLLTSINIRSDTAIGAQAFSGCPNLLFTVSGGSGGLSTLDGGKLLVRDGSTLEAYPSATGDVTLPEGITHISNYVFSNCPAITSVSSGAVTNIGNSAFYWCDNLTSVSFPAAVTIEREAFSWSDKMHTADLRSAVSIGERAFSPFCGLSTIILGPTPPTLGKRLIHTPTNGANASTVTVKIPQDSQTAYGVPELATGTNFNNSDRTSNTWGVGFLGRGWDGYSRLDGYNAEFVNLSFMLY